MKFIDLHFVVRLTRVFRFRQRVTRVLSSIRNGFVSAQRLFYFASINPVYNFRCLSICTFRPHFEYMQIKCNSSQIGHRKKNNRFGSVFSIFKWLYYLVLVKLLIFAPGIVKAKIRKSMGFFLSKRYLL